MTPEYVKVEIFAMQSPREKWRIIASTMRQIQEMETAFSMRRRLNPHHPEKDVRQETRALRQEQYVRWQQIKQLYVAHRDELSNTFEEPTYVECKNILERILVQDFDRELREVIGD